MNKEVVKAMHRDHKPTGYFIFKCRIRIWWRKNKYKIIRIIFFPIWVVDYLWHKYKLWRYQQEEWSDERTTEILNYYIPRTSKWDKKEQALFYDDNGYGWLKNTKKIRFKDRFYWKKYTDVFGGEIKKFLIQHFELEGFEKEIGICDAWQTQVGFYLIKE